MQEIGRETAITVYLFPLTYAADKCVSIRTMTSVCSLTVMVSPAEPSVKDAHSQIFRVSAVNHISCLHVHARAHTHRVNLSEHT